MEQLRVRVAEENAVRDAARRAWQAAVKRAGSDVDLTKDAQAIGADPELQQLILRSWQEVRANQNLPEDVQNWIEVRASAVHGLRGSNTEMSTAHMYAAFLPLYRTRAA